MHPHGSGSSLQQVGILMPSYRVKLKGAPKIIHIEAETFEETPDSADPMSPSNRVAKDANGKEIAWFAGKEISGWWIDQESIDLAEELKSARLRVTEEADSQSRPTANQNE